MPILKSSPSCKELLNSERLGTSWNRICDNKSSIREIDMDSGSMDDSSRSSSSSPTFVGKRMDLRTKSKSKFSYRNALHSYGIELRDIERFVVCTDEEGLDCDACLSKILMWHVQLLLDLR